MARYGFDCTRVYHSDFGIIYCNLLNESPSCTLNWIMVSEVNGGAKSMIVGYFENFVQTVAKQWILFVFCVILHSKLQ